MNYPVEQLVPFKSTIHIDFRPQNCRIAFDPFTVSSMHVFSIQTISMQFTSRNYGPIALFKHCLAKITLFFTILRAVVIREITLHSKIGARLFEAATDKYNLHFQSFVAWLRGGVLNSLFLFFFLSFLQYDDFCGNVGAHQKVLRNVREPGSNFTFFSFHQFQFIHSNAEQRLMRSKYNVSRQCWDLRIQIIIHSSKAR